MNTAVKSDRERTARRLGMSVVVALIVWTLAAVTVSVIRGLNASGGEPPAALDTTTAP